MVTENVCAACGARNAPGEDFCGQCGVYLEFDDAPDRAIPADPGTLVGIAAGERREVSADPQAGERASTSENDAVARDASVGAVLPGMARPKPRRATAETLERPLQPGELVCGHCGAGNQPNRRFCRRCGRELAEAEVARIPWWRRILARRTTRRPAAGSRPRVARRGRGLRSLLKLAVVLTLLAGCVLVTQRYWNAARDGVEDRVRNVEPATPDGVRASSSAHGHPGGSVRDNDPRTYWAPGGTRRAVGQYVEMRFDRPVRLVYVLVSNGVSDDGRAFLHYGRVTRLRATLFTATGDKISGKTLRLMDIAKPQQSSLKGSDVVRVRFTIAGRKRGAPGTLVGIREIELFKRR